MSFESVKHVFYGLVKSGLRDSDDIEAARKVFLVNLFSSAGFLYLFFFGVSAVFNERYMLASVVLGSSLLTVINFLYLRNTGNYDRAGGVVVFIMTVIFVFLICHGGVDNTGPLWCYASAPMILFIYGTIKGGLYICGLIVFSCIVFFVPDMPILFAEYPEAFKTRFIATFAAVTIMSSIHEYSRQQSYERLVETSDELEKQARTDPLTSLPNRREIQDRIEYENVRSIRNNKRYSILVCDIDYFKKLNDEYGHECGDHVLVEVSDKLSKSLREQDTISRWGGEEFLILLPETDYQGAVIVAEKVRHIIEKLEPKFDDQVIKITISVGVGTSDSRGDIKQYIRQADEHLYEAKKNGRNKVVGYE